MWKRAVWIGGACGLLALLTGAAGATQSKPTSLSKDDVILAWRDGPVRYLMTYKEDEFVRGLATVPDLERFITAFWARRDPTPGTLENEYRREYWARVLEADRLYRDSTTPGWKTDRGKVFILLGPPDAVEVDASPGFMTKPASDLDSFDREPHDTKRGLERWTYKRMGAKTSDPEFYVAFVRDASLDWKLSTDADLIQPNFPGSLTTDPTDPQFGGIADYILSSRGAFASGTATPEAAVAQAFPPVDTSVFANYDLGLEIAVASDPELMMATVTARAFLSAFSATPRFEFFRARDGSTFVSIGALVKAADLYPQGASGTSTLRLYASAAPVGRSATTRYVANEGRPARIELAKGPDPGGVFDAWTGLALAPGRYRVLLALEDTLTGRIGRADAEIEVPAFPSQGLALSTLVLASDLSEAEGRLGVTARSSGTFLRSESLGVYYEIYGLPADATARFTASYRFFREMPDGSFTPVSKPIVLPDRSEAAQGWSIPLAKWPAGRYRMEVTVTGADGASASGQADFEVVE